MPKAKSKIEIKNKRASFEYEFLDNYTAGIVLTGTEIKSILYSWAASVLLWAITSAGRLASAMMFAIVNVFPE
ncbi:MAG: SsrA-binding protein, partial [Bacteroidales bacterium]|nr:SsrA-binding protein [Bacteroidales bacterium]